MQQEVSAKEIPSRRTNPKLPGSEGRVAALDERPTTDDLQRSTSRVKILVDEDPRTGSEPDPGNSRASRRAVVLFHEEPSDRTRPQSAVRSETSAASPPGSLGVRPNSAVRFESTSPHSSSRSSRISTLRSSFIDAFRSSMPRGSTLHGERRYTRNISFSTAASARHSRALMKHHGRKSSNKSVSNCTCYGGVLTDYIGAYYRQRTKKNPPENHDKLYRWYRKSLGKEDSDSYGTESSDDEDAEPSDQEETLKQETGVAFRIAKRDKLIQAMQNELLEFWSNAEERHSAAMSGTGKRKTGRGSQPPLAPLPESTLAFKKERKTSALQVEAHAILDLFRESRCLEAEVNSLLFKRKLAGSQNSQCMISDREDIEKKRVSQKNFWKLYHIDENKLPEDKGFCSARVDSPHRAAKSLALTTRSSFGWPTGEAGANGRKQEEQPVQVASEASVRSGSRSGSPGPRRSTLRPGSRLRPNSKQQRPSSKAKKLALERRQLESRTTSTRRIVDHRNHIHEKRIRGNRSESDTDVSALDHRLALFRGKDSVPEASPSDEEVEPQGPYFDIGGFLDPASRAARSKQMKSWTSRYKQVPEKSGSRGRHGQTVGFRALPAIKMASTFTPGMRNCASDGALRGWKMASGDSPNRLPPLFGLSGPFKVPWREEGRAQQKLLGDSQAWTPEPGLSAAQQYINACRRSGVVPTPTAVQMVEKGLLSGAEKNWIDDDLLALGAMVPQLDRLVSVDLSGNTSLSDAVLAQFLNTLFCWSVAGSCENVNLSYCKGLGHSGITVGISLLNDANGLYRLLHLNLSGVFIPSASYLPLCNAVRNHERMKSVQIADTGLGQHPAVRQCVLDLFQMPRLELLDLSWNSFPIDVFELIGKAIALNHNLRTLRMACCSGFHSAAGESPMIYLLECLSRNTDLKLLDISTNQIDCQGALVLEDALECHRGLTELNISQNPLGVEGLRSFLRLLSKNTSGMLYFDCNSCHAFPGMQHSYFNATVPSGRYNLDLEYPYGRAVLRMLYKTCERFSLNPESAFTIEEYLVPPKSKSKGKAVPTKWKHPTGKDDNNIWGVPSTGVLTFFFSVDEALCVQFTTEDPGGGSQGVRGSFVGPRNTILGLFKNTARTTQDLTNVDGAGRGSARQSGLWASSEEAQKSSAWRARLPPLLASKYLEQINDFVRIKPGFRKIVPLLAQFASLKKQARDQLLLVDALSHDFILSYAHVKQLVRSSSRTVSVLPKMLQCVSGGPQRFLSQLLLASNLEEYLNVYNKCQRYILFNPENATGHYCLELSNPSNFALAEQLRMLDRWEAMMARRKGCADFSMYGNWSGIRNVLYNTNDTIPNVITWHLPPTGRLEFDYSSWRRPPTAATWLDPTTWSTLLIQLVLASCRSQDKITALHYVSDQFYVKSVQLRELLGSVSNRQDRIAVITTFIFRLVDPQNVKLVRARLGDESEKQEIQCRLGMLPTFPCFQPEEFKFNLDLGIYEGRTAASAAIHLAVKERLENIRQPSLQFPDGTYYNFIMGCPVSWEQRENLPKNGTLRFRYVCSPEDRKVRLRRELAVKYSGWRLDVSAEDTVWWSGLAEAPDDVLELMYCILRNYEDVYKCFAQLGRLGCWNDQVSISQLRTSMSMDPKRCFSKFLKNPEKLKTAFRYLDPDGSGEISLLEWNALHQLWKELQLSLLEFNQFVDRTFNGNFNLVWQELDSDGSGEVDSEEWEMAVQFIGYFGEAIPIFHYLCDPVTNMITKDGWRKTHDMWINRAKIRRQILEEDDH